MGGLGSLTANVLLLSTMMHSWQTETKTSLNEVTLSKQHSPDLLSVPEGYADDEDSDWRAAAYPWEGRAALSHVTRSWFPERAVGTMGKARHAGRVPACVLRPLIAVYVFPIFSI